MAPTATTELLARVKRDVDRSILRSRNGLKLLSGVSTPPVGVTPKDTVWQSGKVELWRYRSDNRRLRPPLFFVHSLVSRSYVFDLAPGNSFVEFMLAQGFDVFLVSWGEPDAMESSNTLETYCDEHLPDLVDAVCAIAGSDSVTMFGYCMGGMLSLIYAAGHADGPVRSLAVMATPIDFGHMGLMAGLMQAGRVDPHDVLDDNGNVPAEAMLNAFRLLEPSANVSQYVNLWQHMWNDDFVTAHQRMSMWSRDHIAFPGACMIQITDLFARRNLLATGKIPLGGRTVDLADITVPFLNIIGEKDHIVTPESNGNLASLVGSEDVEELRLNAGHVGLIVGGTAHKRNLPAMSDWLVRHSDEQD